MSEHRTHPVAASELYAMQLIDEALRMLVKRYAPLALMNTAVTHAGESIGAGPFGNMILIETSRSELPDAIVRLLDILPGDSLYHLYAHLDQPPDYVLGDIVQDCQPLGEVGESGNTDIPHLHLETRLGPAGKQFESMLFNNTRATIEEMENYVLWRTSGVFRHFDPMTLLSYGLTP